MSGIVDLLENPGNMVGKALRVAGIKFSESFVQMFQSAYGGIFRLFLVLAVFSAVQAIEGYLLTPRIMGKRTGLHPALIIFAVFFWGVALGGILGMMLAIPLTAFAVVFWRLLKRKYIRAVV